VWEVNSNHIQFLDQARSNWIDLDHSLLVLVQTVQTYRQNPSPLFSTQFSVKKAVKAVILDSYREVLVQNVYNQYK
jgi:hypothetical protein